jgi:hypothetical protein
LQFNYQLIVVKPVSNNKVWLLGSSVSLFFKKNL